MLVGPDFPGTSPVAMCSVITFRIAGGRLPMSSIGHLLLYSQETLTFPLPWPDLGDEGKKSLLR